MALYKFYYYYYYCCPSTFVYCTGVLAALWSRCWVVNLRGTSSKEWRSSTVSAHQTSPSTNFQTMCPMSRGLSSSGVLFMIHVTGLQLINCSVIHLFVTFELEHSDSRFESIRRFVFGRIDSNQFVLLKNRPFNSAAAFTRSMIIRP